MGRELRVKETQNAIEPLLYEYYQISDREKMLIDDTDKFFVPSSTPSSLMSDIPTLKCSSVEARKDYVELICKILNSWAKRGSLKVSGAAKISTRLGLGIVSLRKSKSIKPYSETPSSSEFESALGRMKRALPINVGRSEYLRGLKIFEKNQLHIIKPLDMRHWTKTAALNDADELATAILSANRID